MVNSSFCLFLVNAYDINQQFLVYKRWYETVLYKLNHKVSVIAYYLFANLMSSYIFFIALYNVRPAWPWHFVISKWKQTDQLL